MKRIVRLTLLLLGIIFVILCRYIPSLAEGYARIVRFYPLNVSESVSEEYYVSVRVSVQDLLNRRQIAVGVGNYYVLHFYLLYCLNFKILSRKLYHRMRLMSREIMGFYARNT